MEDRRRNRKAGASEAQDYLLSRRQFIKNVGLMAGGITITSMFMASGCDSGSPATTPANTTSNSPANTGTTPPPVTGVWGGEYEADLLYMPELKRIPGCDAMVAMDRLYAQEHMWVKQLIDDIVIAGITERFLVYFEGVMQIELKDVGSQVERNGPFAYIEGKKMNVEAVSPVSGIVLQNNHKIITSPATTINRNVYNEGWIQVIRLTNPAELQELLTPDEYIYYSAKIVSN
ncbi:MAG: hypothetical protein JW954_00555 [Dehalococcoidaceae bacterium]|nr:hypothetical protein [Dehalococcoidaceae bacterium]